MTTITIVARHSCLFRAEKIKNGQNKSEC